MCWAEETSWIRPVFLFAVLYKVTLLVLVVCWLTVCAVIYLLPRSSSWSASNCDVALLCILMLSCWKCYRLRSGCFQLWHLFSSWGFIFIFYSSVKLASSETVLYLFFFVTLSMRVSHWSLLIYMKVFCCILHIIISWI